MRSGWGQQPADSFAEDSLAGILQNAKDNEIQTLLDSGWTIKSENGRQVILTRDGKSITRYRPRT